MYILYKDWKATAESLAFLMCRNATPLRPSHTLACACGQQYIPPSPDVSSALLPTFTW